MNLNSISPANHVGCLSAFATLRALVDLHQFSYTPKRQRRAVDKRSRYDYSGLSPTSNGAGTRSGRTAPRFLPLLKGRASMASASRSRNSIGSPLNFIIGSIPMRSLRPAFDKDRAAAMKELFPVPLAMFREGSQRTSFAAHKYRWEKRIPPTYFKSQNVVARLPPGTAKILRAARNFCLQCRREFHCGLSREYLLQEGNVPE